MVFPGMKVDPMVRPCGGVFLCTPEGTGGCIRKVSLMTAFKYGSFPKDAASTVPVLLNSSSISSCSVTTFSGWRASWKKRHVSVAAVVSLKTKSARQ